MDEEHSKKEARKLTNERNKNGDWKGKTIRDVFRRANYLDPDARVTTDVLLGLTKGWISRGWGYKNILDDVKISHRGWTRGPENKKQKNEDAAGRGIIQKCYVSFTYVIGTYTHAHTHLHCTYIHVYVRNRKTHRTYTGYVAKRSICIYDHECK